jgi:predicted nucleic acid-binding protein
VTLIDSNVLMDVLSRDPRWLSWSVDMLDLRAAIGPLVINDIVYAELSARFADETELEYAVAGLNLRFERTPKPALFVAGQAFRQYRRTGGTRTGVLSDLFIGAHAQVARLPLLTRDTRRYRTYFPEVELIAPDA